MKNKIDLFLDSGAFSAFTQGVEIDIYEYIDFIKTHEKHLSVYANLDVIGDAAGTLKNQRIMEKAGLKPLPCFHYGEDVKYLEIYIEEHDYIALGGMVPISNPNLLKWLDPLFKNHICDSKGMPKVKVHGFGMTSLRLMLRYPWYSVDSTSWVVTGRLGSVYIPKYRNGEWIYNEDSWKISVSNKSPDKKEAGQHIDTLSQLQRKMLLSYINEKGYILGKSWFEERPHDYKPKENEKWAEKKGTKAETRALEIIEERGLSNDYKLRDELNIIYFLDLEKSMKKWPWAFKLKNSSQGFDL